MTSKTNVSAEFVQHINEIEAQQQWGEAVALWQRWLAAYPNNSCHPYGNRAHKRYINALIQDRSLDAAFSAYQLVRQDEKTLTVASDDLLCCVVVRNEALRLPYFLDYYRQQGVAKFLIVDNDSTDETSDYLLAQPDVYLWYSDYPYSEANLGVSWIELLLRRYGVGQWVVLVDADELLYYPECEQRSIVQLCAELTHQKAKAYKAILLDMYAATPIHETRYQKGEDFRAVCPYFDRQFYHFKLPMGDQIKNQTGYWGGVRKRVFGGRKSDYCLNKIPLLYYEADCLLTAGQHATSYPVDQVATGTGCLLHFKFFASFTHHVATEVTRQEHASQGVEYHNYATKLGGEEPLLLYDPAHSLRLRDSNQLIELGIMVQQQSGENEQKSDEAAADRDKQINAYIRLGETWLIKGHVQKACMFYGKILEFAPHFVPAYLRLAYILQQDGQRAEAASYLAEARELASHESRRDE